jgi:hypothetical protein
MSSFQLKAIEEALKHYGYFEFFKERGVSFKFKVLSNQYVRNKTNCSTFEEIFDLLLENNKDIRVDAYLVPCHIHQGFNSWRESMENLVVVIVQKLTAASATDNLIILDTSSSSNSVRRG